MDRAFLSSLILKTLYMRQEMLGYEISQELCLPFTVVDEHICELRREKYIEVSGPAESTSATYRFRITELGCGRARQALEISRYVGPAPVNLQHYCAGLTAQCKPQRYTRQRLERALSQLVLTDDVVSQIGPAFQSQRALFLYGDPGNGKTALANAIGAACGTELVVPYAVEIDGQVIKVLDPIFHGKPGEGTGDAYERLAASAKRAILNDERPDWKTPAHDAGGSHSGPIFDQRWVKVKRPVVFAGGELDLDMLDLAYDQPEGLYEAPLHMKANGGIFIIDDFGRQRVRPRDLLNRWIVPLDRGVDFLTLQTGRKFPIPFRAMVIFATNLNPSDLADEAFLRRIPYKVQMMPPSREDYQAIFLRECEIAGLDASHEAVDYIYRNYYDELDVPVRACHPRDLLRKIVDIANWEGGRPRISPDNLDLVCRSYFLDGCSAPALS